MPKTLVCTACGSPDCAMGAFMCDNAMHAGVEWCTCEWSHSALGASGAMPTFINPSCFIHGEPS